MYRTDFNGYELAFENEGIRYRDALIKYSKMTDVARSGGENPGFAFRYQGRLLFVPCNRDDLDEVTELILDNIKAEEIPKESGDTELKPDDFMAHDADFEPVSEFTDVFWDEDAEVAGENDANAAVIEEKSGRKKGKRGGKLIKSLVSAVLLTVAACFAAGGLGIFG